MHRKHGADVVNIGISSLIGLIPIFICVCLVFPQHYLCVIVIVNRVHYCESWNLLSLSIENHLLSYVGPIMNVVCTNELM